MTSDEDDELERIVLERLQTPEDEFIIMTFEELEKFNAIGERR